MLVSPQYFSFVNKKQFGDTVLETTNEAFMIEGTDSNKLHIDN